MTIFTTQTPGLYNIPNYQYAWRPITYVVGTSISYTYAQGGSFVYRSNSGTAMTDTLPLISNTSADNENASCPNGWYFVVSNNDTTTLTVSAATGNTVSGVASVAIPQGASVTFSTDGVGTNWFASVPVSSSLITVSSGAAVNLAQYGNGARILRSDAGTAMTDTLPNANTLPLSWSIFIRNNDASATDTITPTTSTINGSATLALTAGKSTTIYTDGTNYYANTPE